MDPLAPTERGSRRNWPWIALLWGFAEATIFFVVPDVFITRLALRDSLRRALLACLCALAGALAGGVLLWFVAYRYDAAPPLLRTFTHLPGINRDVIATTGLALYKQGPNALLSGGLLGQPYKLFAVHAGAQQVPFAAFLLVSVVARFTRFALTATVAWLVGLGLRRWPMQRRLQIHVWVWLIFYAVYFFGAW